MATATVKTMSKTAFLTEFLHENPMGNATAANAAWTKAGQSGTISPTLVSKLRSDLGLAGNLWTRSPRSTTKTRQSGTQGAKGRGRPAGKTAAAAKKSRSQGKSAFIKEILIDNPFANSAAVNQAWTAAGMSGTVSQTLVSNVRAARGLSGNLRKTSPTNPTGDPTATPRRRDDRAPVRRSRANDRDHVLAEIETAIDSLIFRLMSVGGLVKAEDDLRRVRRVLCRSHGA